MSNGKDLTGKKFGKLTAIKQVGKDESGKYLWLCKCDCGNSIAANTTDLCAGRKKSCGCLKKERYNIIGQHFGKLTVIRRVSTGTHAKFLCKCGCGNEIIVRGDKLRRGETISCGCNKKSVEKIKKLENGRNLQDHTSDVFFKGTVSKNNTSGINGVSRLRNGKYRAYIGYKNKVYSLIEDYDIKIAKSARDKAERAIKEGTFEQWIFDRNEGRKHAKNR